MNAAFSANVASTVNVESRVSEPFSLRASCVLKSPTVIVRNVKDHPIFWMRSISSSSRSILA